MPLETASTIAELNENNPVGASDTPASLDNHIQLIKAVLKADALVKADIGVTVPALSHTHSGAITSSGYTQSTAKLLGRTTAGTGAVEEISVSGATLSGGTLTITPTSFASSAENAAGTIENKSVDPLGVREAFNATGTAPIYACRAWVNFDGTGSTGTNQTILGSGNITSVYKNGTGDYTITFATAMPDANYAVVASGQIDQISGVAYSIIGVYRGATGQQAGSVRIGTNSTTPSAYDYKTVSVSVFR